MVLDILSDKLGPRNCIRTQASARKVAPWDTTEDLATEDAPANDAKTVEPAYDPRIVDMHRDDADLEPGIRELRHSTSDDGANRTFVTAL